MHRLSQLRNNPFRRIVAEIGKVNMESLTTSKARTQICSVLAIGFSLIASTLILFVYRRGGVVDAIYGPHNSPGFRDTGIYAHAARQIFSGLSPYSDEQLAFRSGSYGVLIFGLLPLGTLTYIFYQVLNLIGIFTFSIIFLRDLVSRQVLLATLALGICFSSVREIFSTGQITGIIAGLMAVGFECLKSEKIIRRLSGAFFFSLALDLKPNLIIFFVIGSYIFLNRIRDVWMPILFLLIGHLAVDVYVGRLLEIEWLATLRLVGDPYRDPSNTGTRTIWPLIRLILEIEVIPGQIPTLLFLLLGAALLFTLWKTRNYLLLALTFVLPAFYNYFHLYSFFPFAIFVFALLIKKEMPILLGVLFPFLLVSGGNFAVSQLLFCMVLSSALVVYLYSMVLKQHDLIFVRRFSITVALVCTSRFLFQILFDSSLLQEIIILNTLVFAGIGLVFVVNYQDIVLKSNNKTIY